MAKMNLQTRFAKALESRGLDQVARRPKYLVFSRTPDTTPPTFYYLGAAGSLRYGANYTTSHPVPDAVKQTMLTVTAHLA
jgi:formamidopyrimidine-DNA glycosylase